MNFQLASRFLVCSLVLVCVYNFQSCTNSNQKSDSFYNAKKAEIRANHLIQNYEAGKTQLHLLRYGEESSRKQFDKATGLEIQTLGCELEPGVEEYIAIFNQKIKKYWIENKNK